MSNTILATENQAWGFWGTMGERAAVAWPLAFTAILDATKTEADAVRAFLDSRHGRHFADGVFDGLNKMQVLEDAIDTTVAIWMAWRISKRTSQETGIPAGLPYLTAHTINEGAIAEGEHAA